MSNATCSPNPHDEETTGILSVLANSRRQFIVRRLVEIDNPIALADLTQDIATLETGEEGVNPEVAQGIRIQLRHNHIPKLCDYGVASYNEDRQTLSRAANTAKARRVLAVAID